MTLDALIDQYELGAKLRGVSPTQLVALKPIRRALGCRDVSCLTPGEIASYIGHRRDGLHTNAHGHRPAKDGTIRRELGALSAVLNWGYAKRLIDKAPTIDLPAMSPPRETFLAQAEADQLWDFGAAWEAGHPGDFTGRFVCLALDTWARANAIETLPWIRTDVLKRRIDFRDPTRPSTKKRRVPVPMSRRLYKLIFSWERGVDSDLVVGPVSHYAYRKFMDASGVPGAEKLTRHDLRRTGISCALARGVEPLKVAQMAGDDLATIMKHYAHFMPDYLDGVVE